MRKKGSQISFLIINVMLLACSLSIPQLGNLLLDFNFNQTPIKPLILPFHAAAGPASIP
jgi:hypothetical protein